jgi:hypothetical protein
MLARSGFGPTGRPVIRPESGALKPLKRHSGSRPSEPGRGIHNRRHEPAVVIPAEDDSTYVAPFR